MGNSANDSVVPRGATVDESTLANRIQINGELEAIVLSLPENVYKLRKSSPGRPEHQTLKSQKMQFFISNAVEDKKTPVARGESGPGGGECKHPKIKMSG